jgi:hypothetical protein
MFVLPDEETEIFVASRIYKIVSLEEREAFYWPKKNECSCSSVTFFRKGHQRWKFNFSKHFVGFDKILTFKEKENEINFSWHLQRIFDISALCGPIIN